MHRRNITWKCFIWADSTMFASRILQYRGATKLQRLGKSAPNAAYRQQAAAIIPVSPMRQFSTMRENAGDALVYSRIKSAYGYAGGGIAITAASATPLCNLGFPMMMVNTGTALPLCASLATTIPLLFGTLLTNYHKNPQKKKALWVGFLVAHSATLSVLGLVSPTVLIQAGAATGLMMGGLTIGGMCTDPTASIHYRAPLGAALGVVAAASIGQIFLPLPIMDAVSLYGGLLVFSALTVTDTQDLIQDASLNIPFDPINASLNIYLNTLNIFVRMVRIVGDISRGSDIDNE